MMGSPSPRRGWGPAPTPSASPPKHPARFFEMYIAEQQMVAAAIGLQTRARKPFASSFGAFLSGVMIHPHGGDLRPPT